MAVTRMIVALTVGGIASMVPFGHAEGQNPSTPKVSPTARAVSTAPDPRVGLRPGLFDAGEAIWNLRVLSKTPPSEKFIGRVNSDLAFSGKYAIQGSFDGYQIWDISDPRRPTLKASNVCPASQSDVSVYRNLLFISGESLNGRIDCGVQGVRRTVSTDRLRGLRIFDITDITRPRNVGNVQTCRGSHTHTVLVDPKDRDNIYVYISGSAPVRSDRELTGCARGSAPNDPASARFRIEVIKVPLAHPERAAIVSSPRIFSDLVAPAKHGETLEDIAASRTMLDSARAAGGYVVSVGGRDRALSPETVAQLLDSLIEVRNGTGEPTAADSATLRLVLPQIYAADSDAGHGNDGSPKPGPNQCHDITVYPAIGLAGGACGGYGLLLDIRDPANPVRIGAAADSNFSFWHSATFNNDGTKILFSDEWGGGTQAKCRVTDKPEWGANAIFTLSNREMKFRSYYKLPAPQTPLENCVAHNGSLIPIPGRDVMVQAWYQGGISVFDWTDAANPREIAFFDRGPEDSTRMTLGGTWSAYWYNGSIVSSEITRGLDILELAPSAFISQNEIDAAKTVTFDYFNTQSQQKLVWPPSFALARAYLDQIERSKGLPARTIVQFRAGLIRQERASGEKRRSGLITLAARANREARLSRDSSKVRLLSSAISDLASKPQR